MSPISRGFRGRRRDDVDPSRVPPGQYVVRDFPVLSAGPTPRTPLDEWSFAVRGAVDAPASWTWDELLALPQETFTVDIHCVTKWSKLGTTWTGVSVDTLLDGVETEAEHVTAYCDGDYTINLPLADVTDGRAWVAHTFEGEPLEPEHGGPARLLVPHLPRGAGAAGRRRGACHPDARPAARLGRLRPPRRRRDARRGGAARDGRTAHLRVRADRHRRARRRPAGRPRPRAGRRAHRALRSERRISASDDARWLDGNALAGLLGEVFGAEMTTVPRACPDCGARSAVGAHRAYLVGAAAVLRCPACGQVALRVTSLPDRHVVVMRGEWQLEVPRP